MPKRPRVTAVSIEDELLDRQYVARWLGVNPTTLARWEREGYGPPTLRVGDLVRYQRSTVKQWIRSQTKTRMERG